MGQASWLNGSKFISPVMADRPRVHLDVMRMTRHHLGGIPEIIATLNLIHGEMVKNKPNKP